MKNITFIGSGNIATRLGIALKQKNYNISQVFSRSKENAQELARKIDSSYINDINKLKDADLFLVCVSDDVIMEIINKITFLHTPIVHTSGCTDINVLNRFISYGSFYPLQSFQKDVEEEFNSIPIFLESNNDSLRKNLLEIAYSLSDVVYEISSYQRKQLHLAAVFCSNFTNHLLSISENILEKNDLDFNMLKPIIIRSIKKIKDNSPLDIQTGPAMRKDYAVIKSHIEMILDDDIKDIYQRITNHIIKTHEADN